MTRDVLSDGSVESSSPGTEADAARIREELENQQVCPFCGTISDGSDPVCGKCAMENTAVARKATKLRIGPWYVLQNRNPAAPGMKWETLLSFVRKGRVKPQTIVRGPTTHQLWRFAAQVKGLSREFGVCYSCGGAIEKAGNLCQHCNRLQEPPINPDSLLEGENEPRITIFKEIPAGAPEPAPLSAPEFDVKSRLDEAALQLREMSDSDRQALERERQSAAKEREAARREREAIAREREALRREKEQLERDRSEPAIPTSTARPNRAESARGEPATESAAPRRASAASPPASAGSSVWDLVESDSLSDSGGFEAIDPASPTGRRSSALDKNGLPRIRTRDGGFLSAKDLAAAFKLNHSAAPARGGDIPAARLDDAGSPAPRGKAGAIGVRRPPRRSSGGKWFLLFLVLLAWVAVGVSVKPAWREKVVSLWMRYVPHHAAPAATQPASPDAPDASDAATSDLPADRNPAPEGILPGGIPLTPHPSTEPTPAPAPPTAPPATEPAAAPPAAAVPPASSTVIAPPPAPASEETHPATAPAPALDPATPAPATSAIALPATVPSTPAPATPPQDAYAQAKMLYHAANEAEVRGDFAEALRLYTEIQKLPPDAWPTDLEMRLRSTRHQPSSR